MKPSAQQHWVAPPAAVQLSCNQKAASLSSGPEKSTLFLQFAQQSFLGQALSHSYISKILLYLCSATSQDPHGPSPCSAEFCQAPSLQDKS